jgi:hypothetical protein
LSAGDSGGRGFDSVSELAVRIRPGDPVERPTFVAKNRESVERIAEEMKGISALAVWLRWPSRKPASR